MNSRNLMGVVAVAFAALLAGCSSSDAGGTPALDGAMGPEPFGTHVKDIARGDQPLPARAGSVRLWDSGVAWRELEPEPGQVDWAAMDTAVEQAESTGAADIMWVHGSPPPWAAQDPEAAGLYGPGTSSAPDEDAYLSILRAIAERYKGRITSYQVWNEANINIFYRGEPEYLAQLTARAHAVLDEVDPDAILVGASTTVREKGPVKPWYGKYSAALAELGWPVDAMAVHLYPLAEHGPNTRVAYIRTIKDWLAERGWTGPLYDTEVNYGDRRDFATKIVEVPQDRAADWVARTYLDSLALGVDRVYWYSWNDHILGIDQVDPGTGEVLPAGQAYLTVQDWLVGSRWEGCSGELMDPTGERGALTTCDITYRDGSPAQVLFTLSGKAEVDLQDGVASICTVDGTCADPDGDTLEVGTGPLLVRQSA